MESNTHQPAAASSSEVSSHGSPEQQQEVVVNHDHEISHQGRSYECNFCKKGFSNAQALGGHMNIHRKDKAKLKQANNSKQTHHKRLLMNSDTTNSHLTHSRSSIMAPSDVTSGQPKSNNNAKWPCIYSSDLDKRIIGHEYPRDTSHVPRLIQLPLFVEKADHSDTTIHVSGNWQDQELHSGHGSELELDLELRLGHKPPNKSSLVMGTRKFF